MLARADARKKKRKAPKKKAARVGSKVPRRGITQINMSGPTRDYFDDLLKLTGATETAIRSELLDGIDVYFPAEGEPPGDFDQARALKRLERAINTAQKRIEKLDAKARQVASRAGDRSQKVHRTQQEQQFAQIGIDVFNEAPQLEQVLTGFTRVNVKLIKSIPSDELERVEGIMVDAIRTGRRAESVAKDIEREFDISENRAKLIARDQIGKIQSDLSRTRMLANDVTKAIWRDSDDERVRPRHESRDGRVYNIEDGIAGERPGEPINCRCTAEAVL